LNGAPRAGKSSIVAAIQDAFDGPWMNLGVDQARQITPPRYQPGIGLRPGEADHEAAPFVSVFYDLEVDTSVLSPEGAPTRYGGDCEARQRRRSGNSRNGAQARHVNPRRASRLGPTRVVKVRLSG